MSGVTRLQHDWLVLFVCVCAEGWMEGVVMWRGGGRGGVCGYRHRIYDY